jgi:hypothetical protein
MLGEIRSGYVTLDQVRQVRSGYVMLVHVISV